MSRADLVEIGRPTTVFSVSGKSLGFRLEVHHKGLHKHRVIKGADLQILQRKAQTQVAAWQQQWAVKEGALARDAERAKRQADRTAGIRLAEEATERAQALLRRLQNTLAETLPKNDAIDWDDLKDRSPFPEPTPTPPPPPREPTLKKAPQEPRRDQFAPKLGLLDRLLPSRRARKEDDGEAQYDSAVATWQRGVQAVETANAKAQEDHRQLLVDLEKTHAQAVAEWEARRQAFQREQVQTAAAVDAQRDQYQQREPEAIESYCDLVLTRSAYPECFPKEWDLEFLADARILVVNYFFPAPQDMPAVGEVRYVASKNEFVDKTLTTAQIDKLYDEVLYQLTLRTIHELFEADVVGALDTVAFNGYVRSIDKATGQEITACVLSVTARRDEFLAINLANVHPKACFKSLKGVGSSKLHSITPIAPIIEMNREDPRFVASHEVASTLSEGSNLAAMDWEEFEHLIREVFEKEFASAGGEVKVTQASRDGGVDAVVFDPDPIRGGKIVIQAKRYTGTVGVSAVRDLYGTVMNEGATKGILVTTSDYGPDAYEFVRGKPLSLLNGGNLLHLLEKHGHKARIDLREAKALGADKPTA